MHANPRLSAPRVPIYRMYVDEVGNHNGKNFAQKNERYFSLTGVIFEKSYAEINLTQSIEQLKVDHIPTHSPSSPVILHRYDIMRRRGPFSVLSRFTSAYKFDRDLLAILSSSPYTVITCVVDRQAQQQKYFYPEDAYSLMLQFLTERYCRFLESEGNLGDILMESRGRRHDRILEQVFPSILSGTHCRPNWLSSQKLKFKDKRANEAGLQVADIVANPSAQHIRSQQSGEIVSPGFGFKIVDVLKTQKYRRSYSGQVDGYGTKFFP